MTDSTKPNTNVITLEFNGVKFCLNPDKLHTEKEGCTSLSIVPNGQGEFTRIDLTSFTGTLCIFKSCDKEGIVTSRPRDKSVTVEDEELISTPNRSSPQFVSPPPGQKQLPFERKRRIPSSASEISIPNKKMKKTFNDKLKLKKQQNLGVSFFASLGQSSLGQSTTQLSQSSTENTIHDPEICNTEIKDVHLAHSTSSIKTTTKLSLHETNHYEAINAQDSSDNHTMSDTKYVEEEDNHNTIMEFDDENSILGPEMTTSTLIEYAPKSENVPTIKQEIVQPATLDKSTPCVRWGQSMVLIDNSQLLIYGGETVDPCGKTLKTLSDLHVYDLTKQQWTKPINCDGMMRAWHSVTFLPDRQLLIAFGGESIQDTTQKTMTMEKIMVLDTEIMLWYPPSISGVAPSACSGHTATLLPDSNELVIFGGVKNNRWKNNIAVLDTQCWSWKTPKVTGLTPRARSDHTITLVSRSGKNGNRLVLFGGKDGSKSFNSVHVLDTTNDKHWSWFHPTVSGTSPSPRSGHSATLLEDNKTILMYGGWDPYEEGSEQSKNEDIIYGDTHLLDTESWSWRPGPKSKYVKSSGPNGGKYRVGHSAVLAPGLDATQVLVFGGRLQEDEFANDIQAFTISRRMLRQRKR